MPSFQLECSTGSNLINQFHQLSLTIAPVVLLLSKPDRVMNSDPCLSFIIMRGSQYIPYFNCFTKLICPSPMSADRAVGSKSATRWEVSLKISRFRSELVRPSLPRNITLFSLPVHMDVVLADRGELLCFLWYRLRIMMTSRQQKWCDPKNESNDGE